MQVRGRSWWRHRAVPVVADSRAFSDRTLADLRAGGWTPSAWGRYLLALSRRSAEQVAAHPRAAAEMALAHAAVALSGSPRRAVIGAATALTHLGLLGPARSVGPATAISVARGHLIALRGVDRDVLAVVAGLSDKLDGFVARRRGPTMFGFYADAVADCAFWTEYGLRDESAAVRAGTLGAWLLPLGVTMASSFASGRLVEPLTPAVLRPGAGMQIVLTARAGMRVARAVRAAGRPATAGGSPAAPPR